MRAPLFDLESAAKGTTSHTLALNHHEGTVVPQLCSNSEDLLRGSNSDFSCQGLARAVYGNRGMRF